MVFDLSNYIFFILLCAAVYVAISTYLQGNIGGKGKLKSLQMEMREIQKKMGEAGKKRDDKELDRLMGENMKLTSELMVVQFKFMAVILVVFLALATLFTFTEPGHEDDVKFALLDNGLAANCDFAANDGTYSGCLAIPANATAGAWTIDVFMKSTAGEQLSRSGTVIFVERGTPEDAWVQTASQGGILDMVMGKTAFHLNVTSDNPARRRGETVAIYASSIPPARPEAVTFEASSNMGTFFYVDLPVTLPLLNIRRIIGSTGVLIFSAFLLSIGYSILKAIYGYARKNSGQKT